MFIFRESNKDVSTSPKANEPAEPEEEGERSKTEVTYTIRTNPESCSSEAGSSPQHNQAENQKVCWLC